MEEKPTGKFADFVGQAPPDIPRGSRSIPWKALILTFLGLVLLCFLVTSLTLLYVDRSIAREQPVIEEVANEFMRAMAARDTTTAYAMFSQRAQRQVPKDALDKLVQGRQYALFDGFQKAEVTGIKLSRGIFTNPNLPQGVFAVATGVVHYENDLTGQFNMVLEKEEGRWRIHNFHVTVPVEKFP